MNTFVNTIGVPGTPVNPIISRTANGMRAYTSTSNACLDLFGSIGASRGKDIIPQFDAAFAENMDLAIRIAQWARDVRGGAGERQLYRNILLRLEQTNPGILVTSNILANIAEIGRFDDLLIFTNPEVKYKAYSIIAQALDAGNGLAAKWMPRKGPIAVELRKVFGLSPREYRKLIVGLTTVVEQEMCSKNWNEINFSHVPSVAMTRYMSAFQRNAPERFAQYKEALSNNTAKVNANAVYPYQIIDKMGGARDLFEGHWYSGEAYKFDQVLQSMWDALPNYMNDANVIAVVDNSGSMSIPVRGTTTTCATVAASLGMYTAAKSTGAFKDLSITFNSNAKFVKHEGTIDKRLEAVCAAPWGTTDLHSVFDLILRHATLNRVPQKDMPAMVVIFSDMQFNSCVTYDDSAQQMIRRKYEDAGYDMPQIVFWNLNDYGNKPVKFNDQGVALVSGFSPAVMEAILSADVSQFTPEAVMLKAVAKERYNW